MSLMSFFRVRPETQAPGVTGLGLRVTDLDRTSVKTILDPDTWSRDLMDTCNEPRLAEC